MPNGLPYLLVWLIFSLPQFSWEPLLFMIPVAIAPVIEHIGDVYVVGAVATKTLPKTLDCIARFWATVLHVLLVLYWLALPSPLTRKLRVQ